MGQADARTVALFQNVRLGRGMKILGAFYKYDAADARCVAACVHREPEKKEPIFFYVLLF